MKKFAILYPRPSWRTPKLQYKPSVLKQGHSDGKKQFISSLLSFLEGHFCPLLIRIRIQPTKINADPKPQQRLCAYDKLITFLDLSSLYQMNSLFPSMTTTLGLHNTTVSRSRIHECTISLRFLGLIFRVLRLVVSVNNVYITHQFQTAFAQGGWGE